MIHFNKKDSLLKKLFFECTSHLRSKHQKTTMNNNMNTDTNARVITSHKKIHISTIRDEDYHHIMREVLALKPRKRKLYKGFLFDKHGQKSRVRFYKGQLQDYDSTTHRFGVLESFSQTRARILIVEAEAESPVVEATSTLGLAVLSGRDEIALKILEATIEDSHTGNHYRNHYVKVPKGVYG